MNQQKNTISALEQSIKSLTEVCKQQANMIQLLTGHGPVPILENSNTGEVCTFDSGGTNMGKKIRRPVMINGKKQWICADTEQEYAEAIMAALGTAPTASDVPTEKPKHNFKDYAERWFQVFSKPNVSTSSVITYERQLRLYIYPIMGDMNIEDVTAADVQRVFNLMDEGTAKSKAAKEKARMVLNQIFAQALEEELIAKNPMNSRTLRIKGAPNKQTEPFTVEEMTYLAQHLQDIKQPFDRNYLCFQMFHPFRLEEVLGLKWKDVDISNRVIHIRSTVTHPDRNQPQFLEKTKTDQSRRNIPLVPFILPLLTVGAPDEFVVGGKKPISYTQESHMLSRIRKDTGFSGKLSPLRFRTTVLTDIYDSTKDIKATQAAAGHTTAAMTLKHYVKGRQQDSTTADVIAAKYGVSSIPFFDSSIDNSGSKKVTAAQ